MPSSNVAGPPVAATEPSMRRLLAALRDHAKSPALLDIAATEPEPWDFERVLAAARDGAARLRDAGIAPGEMVALPAAPSALAMVAILAAIEADVGLCLATHAGPALASWRWAGGDSEPGRLGSVVPRQGGLVLQTAGAGGRPRPLRFGAPALLAALDALAAADLYADDERVLLPLPLDHPFPLIAGALAALAAGATLLPVASGGTDLVAAIRRLRPTTIVGTPHMLGELARAAQLIGDQPADPLAGIRQFVSFGAPFDPDVAWRLERRGARILHGYGLAEAGGIVAFAPAGWARPDAIGAPLPGVEVTLGDDGEILVRTAQAFEGYADQATTPAVAARGDWLRSGDLGARDAHGDIRFLCRRSERLALPGGGVAPAPKIERTIVAGPYLREAAVRVEPDGLTAIAVADVEALRGGATGRVNDLLLVEAKMNALALPPAERPVRYRFRRLPLPRTLLGALRRDVIAEEAPNEPPGEADRALLAAPLAARLWGWLGQRFPDAALSLDTSPQLELGIDSIDWVDLALELQERFAVVLDEAAIGRVLTLRDLLNECLVADGSARPFPADWRARPAAALPPEHARWVSPTPLPHKLLGVVFYWLNWVLMRLYFRLEVFGRGNLPPAEPVVIAVNHASDIDQSIVGAALPWRQLRRTRWAADEGRLFGGPLRRAFCRASQVFPVNDYFAGMTIASGLVALHNGESVVWFPEGWRSPDHRLLPFARGIGVVLKESGARVVPVRLEGTLEAMPRWAHFPLPRKVTISFGKPLDPAELEAAGEGRDAYARIADGLRRAMAAQAAEISPG
jgi:long-chain acyl-CoA synthetase